MTFTMDVEEEELIFGRFHTLGLNFSDMGSKAAMQKVHCAPDSPTNLSALKWQSTVTRRHGFLR
ncbi:MAG TPA: hypothetical protein PKV75_10035 [Desulfobacterales bacterium]|nr:hypothetical protein [Desulfobacterales bacterium]